ncbi:MAG: hypothetical protein ACTSQJ_17135, partial [Promethearchaeota archaeon]
MERIKREKRKRQYVFLLIGVFLFQALIFALIFLNNISIVDKKNYVENEDKQEEPKQIEEIKKRDGTLPNLTRENYPFILNNKSAEFLWTTLHGHHINNIRIAYYSINNQWKLIPFQLDEMGFFRTYKYEIGFQATVSFTSPNNVDLANWGHYEVEHRYAGKHINDTSATPYQEPTEYECMQSYWHERLKEGYYDGDTPPDPPTQDPREQPGGAREQLLHRIDWDDELCFYAKNGKKVTQNNWWNYDEYPNRFRIKIVDPVDGGQSWMYLYYNDVDLLNPPTIHYYIPPGEQDYVSWDKQNLKITGQTYELGIDDINHDLDKNLKIKWPGLPPNDLYTDSKKQYISVWFRVYYDYGLGAIDENDDTEVWRDGQWDEGYYDEQYSAIGYNIQMDFGWDDASTGDWSGHRTASGHPTGNDPVSEGKTDSSNTHSVNDQRHTALFSTQVTTRDSADHDNDFAEITPFVRGWVNFPTGSNEAAIDGPCRVILDRFIIQCISVSMSSPIRYEELWTCTSQRSKYYANLIQTDPYILDLNLNEPGSDF